ncbi:major prion protein homolog [Austrofundulus limnaeus]|uniref:Major prion protein homolog n=1 Tax=Austrofundulus limnaeus TaxID=52670 RepID=A0A2I4ARB4_AUSLI|nr:PREDICTED: major prion protein homolog [Austrofundulus limnaeus]
MNMKSLPVLCMLLLLFHTPFLLAKGGGGGGRGGFGRGFSSKTFSTSNRGNTNKASKNNQGSTSQGGKQQGKNQGGHPSQDRYPRTKGGGYYNRFPGTASPLGGQYGGYPGGYMNYNPNNRILSPRYGGSFGYGGYNVRGGSPFSQSVHAMGMHPGARSKGFGRNAVMAAAGGAMAGMALGYGLGRFPRPHFHFHNPQEEYYYNHYMYRKYGAHSTDTNDYSRDYKFNPPPQDYNSYMDLCMKNTDILPTVSQNSRTKPATSTKTNTDKNLNTPDPSTLRPLNQPKTGSGDSDEDNDTVSIVEIGYPALIEQVKARKCLQAYMVYSERYLVKQTGGAQELKMSVHWLLSVISVVLINNILMLVQ